MEGFGGTGCPMAPLGTRKGAESPAPFTAAAATLPGRVPDWRRPQSIRRSKGADRNARVFRDPLSRSDGAR